MENKMKERILKNIEWGKGAQGGWEGSFTLPDGYKVSIVANVESKMRAGKALVKEMLPDYIEAAAQERNVAIFKD